MADDNRNLEDQLNILFDDFDDEVEEISEKAAETVQKAAEPIVEVKAPEKAPSVSIPTLNLERLQEEKAELPKETVPAFELPKAEEIPAPKDVVPDLDDTVIDTKNAA